MSLRLTRRARQDIVEIGAFLRERNPAAAIRVRDAISDALRLIAEHPQSGRDLGGGLWRLPVTRTPYLAFYRIDTAADRVVVITIRHASRRPESTPPS